MKNLIVLLCLLALPSMAKAEGRFDQGSWELAFGTDLNGSVSPLIGYFLVDNLEAIAHFSYSDVELEETSTGAKTNLESTTFSLQGIFNIPTDTIVVPLLGLGFEFINLSEDNADLDSTALDVIVGLRFLIGKIASANLTFSLGFAEIDVDSVDIDGESKSIDLSYSLFF